MVMTHVFLGTKAVLKRQFLFGSRGVLSSRPIGIEITVRRCWIIHTVSGRALDESVRRWADRFPGL